MLGRAEMMEKQLNDLGVEGYAVVYANEAIIILGHAQVEFDRNPPARTRPILAGS